MPESVPYVLLVTINPPDGLTKLADASTKAIALSVKYTAAEAWGNLKREAAKDTTHGAGSLQLSKVSDMEWKIFSSLAYMYYLNTGTKPHYAPWGPIKEWAKRHSLPPFPIWYSILKKGTKANKYVDRAFEQTNARAEEFLRRAMRETGSLGAA